MNGEKDDEFFIHSLVYLVKYEKMGENNLLLCLI